MKLQIVKANLVFDNENDTENGGRGNHEVFVVKDFVEHEEMADYITDETGFLVYDLDVLDVDFSSPSAGSFCKPFESFLTSLADCESTIEDFHNKTPSEIHDFIQTEVDEIVYKINSLKDSLEIIKKLLDKL